MNSLFIGWEVSNLVDGGANLVVPVNRNIVIVGYQLTIAMAYVAQTVGFSEVLSLGAVTNGMPQFATGPGPCYISPPDGYNSDFGATTTVNPNNFLVGGGGIGWNGNLLYSAILKTNAPQAVNDVLMATNLSFPAGPGDNIVIHADAAGLVCDWEIQGCIYYTAEG